MKYDVVIVGAGILGCLTARELKKYKLDVLVLDKESDIGEGATKANSGVLYAGFILAAEVSRGFHAPEETECMNNFAKIWTCLWNIQAHCL